MTEKGFTAARTWPNYPVPMKFYGAWDVDKTPANCTPRLCTLTITKLLLQKPLRPDFSAVIVAVKMQSSKRILRSNEIIVSKDASALLQDAPVHEVELDLTFSLQYPHFLKKGGNQLQILLQRRKRYKNRAILGFKTLAVGTVNMAEVLQRSTYMEKLLELRGNLKELGTKDELPVAHVMMSTIKSQPIDQDERVARRSGKSQTLFNRSADVDSDEVYDDFTSNDEGSDSEPIDEGAGPSAAHHSAGSAHERSRRGANNRKPRKLFPRNVVNDSLENGNSQRNLKQKFKALLKKFRIPDSDAFESEEQYEEAIEQGILAAQNDDDEEFEEEDLDDLRDIDYSDSGQEFDDVSISSTPKPHLKPFFSSCTLIEGEGEQRDINGTRASNHDFLGTSAAPSSATQEQTPDISDTSLRGQGIDEHLHGASNLNSNTRRTFFNSIISRYRKPHP